MNVYKYKLSIRRKYDNATTNKKKKRKRRKNEKRLTIPTNDYPTKESINDSTYPNKANHQLKLFDKC